MSNKPKMTSGLIRELLRERFSDRREFSVAEEVGDRTGYNNRRIDMVVCNAFQSNGYYIEGIEIKISKSDLRTELQNSDKHNIFFPNLDYFSLAAPKEIIDLDIIPKTWGIYQVYWDDKNDRYKLKRIRKPLSLHDTGNNSISKEFFASLFRAIPKGDASADLDSYQRGYEAGQESLKRELSHTESHYEEINEELRSYEKLFNKCHFYGRSADTPQQVDVGIAKFEAFRNYYGLSSIESEISSVIRNLRDLRKLIIELKDSEDKAAKEAAEPYRNRY